MSSCESARGPMTAIFLYAGFAERQELAFVAEKNRGALGGKPSNGTMFGRGEDLLRASFVHVGMVEEAEAHFHFEDGTRTASLICCPVISLR